MVEVIFVAEVPVYLMVEVDGVNVPETTKGVPLPERVTVRDEAFRVPAVRFRTDAIVWLS